MVTVHHPHAPTNHEAIIDEVSTRGGRGGGGGTTHVEGVDFAVMEAAGGLDTGRSSEVQDLQVPILVAHESALAV